MWRAFSARSARRVRPPLRPRPRRPSPVRHCLPKQARPKLILRRPGGTSTARPTEATNPPLFHSPSRRAQPTRASIRPAAWSNAPCSAFVSRRILCRPHENRKTMASTRRRGPTKAQQDLDPPSNVLSQLELVELFHKKAVIEL